MTRHTYRKAAVPVGERAAVEGSGGDIAEVSLVVQTTGGFEPPTLAMPAYGAHNWTVHASYLLIRIGWAWARV